MGQTVVVADAACVAVEAMEGTDAVIERAASLVNGRALRVVKLAKPNQDLRFDVPVIGMPTVEVMKRAGVTAMAIEARKTLMIDREELLREADAAGIAIVAGNETRGLPGFHGSNREIVARAIFEMMKVAVIGVGHLGKHHARLYAEMPGTELVGRGRHPAGPCR